MDETAALYDLIYSGVAASTVYRESALRELDLPDWVVPLSALHREDLERIASELRLRAGDSFIDLACGLGGPSLWIAQQTGTCVTGVDISETAIVAARRLAAGLGLDATARFVTADATRTELPAHAYAGVMSIDAIQFMNPQRAVTEIARLLRPGGRAAITTWEALADVELPTVVRDYRPFLEGAGLRVDVHEIVENAHERGMRYFRALAERAEELRAEIGEAAEPILHEAAQRIASEHKPPRVRKVFIAAASASETAVRRPSRRSDL